MNEPQPLDTAPIEARLKESKLEGREIRYISVEEIGFGPKPTTLESMTDEQEVLFIHAPTDIAALLAELDRLRAENERLREEMIRLDPYRNGWFSTRGQEAFEREAMDRANGKALDDFEGVGTEGD